MCGQGKVKVNDTIELPEQKVQRKVKSLQVFRQSVSSCQQVRAAALEDSALQPLQLRLTLSCLTPA